MNSPADQVFVLKDGERRGPFSRDELLSQIERGAVNYEDPCLRTGATECQRVRDILGGEASDAGPASEPRGGIDHRFEPEPDFGPVSEEEDDDDEDEEEDGIGRGDLDGGEAIFDVENQPEGADAGPPADPNTVLYAGHPSVLSFPKTLFIIAGSLGAGWWFRENSGWIFLAGLIVALFGVSWILLERAARLYLITPRRVEIITGLIAKSSNEVRVEDIRTINVMKSGLIGLIGVGTVEFASAGGSTVEVSFQHVWAAHRIKGLVRRLQDAREE